MKAVYNLNQERLGFNYKILSDKQAMSALFAKKLNRMKGKALNMMMDVRENFRRQQAEDATTNKNSTKSFKRFTRYFIIL